ncbi:AAA family ATPase [Candidatus Amarolinea dominans]|uniref:AAA family ATPase n=1 Tax=Candidatus Amarolinea dominans TaxID=3140696 RepID=UPI00313609A8|nr:AAA family ATPase [Anaerolineae bacterium]MBK9230106.1 AAA family ATPase [Anaerolineae bacterium]
MLIKELKVSGLLSFGPKGMTLPLGNLNVLIGPNGSGKSNLLEVLALLKAAPTNLPAPVREMGGVREWLWKPASVVPEATIEAIVEYVGARQPLRHGLVMADHGGRFEVVDEWIENERPKPGYTNPYVFYRFQRGNPVLGEPQAQAMERQLQRENVKPEQSVLSQIRDPERYPALGWLQERYEQIRLFRSWTFGPTASLRREQSTHGRSDFLVDGGENLALVLSKIRSRIKPDLIEALRELYEGIEDVNFQIDGGNVLLFLEERGGREIPATRLSDGTLRYLCLLAILLHPDPPPLIAIEEPELGLHPDIIPQLAKLLVAASERTQLVVTTHSDVLVDALTSQPESVIVCEKVDGESQFRRLDADQLKEWLEKYTLGQLWSMGEIGGNRW